jgi:hypothetical protein
VECTATLVRVLSAGAAGSVRANAWFETAQFPPEMTERALSGVAKLLLITGTVEALAITTIPTPTMARRAITPIMAGRFDLRTG